jgi:hypothetical protein
VPLAASTQSVRTTAWVPPAAAGIPERLRLDGDGLASRGGDEVHGMPIADLLHNLIITLLPRLVCYDNSEWESFS